MTRRSRVYIGAIGILGGAVAVASAALLPTAIGDPWTAGILVVLAAAAALVPLRFIRNDAVQGFTLEGGVLVALLLVGALGWAPLVLVGASALAHGVRSRDVHKTVFNAGRTGLETAAGTAVYWLVAPPEPDPASIATLGAVALAAIAYEVVSIVAMAELFHHLSGDTRRAAVRDVADVSAVTFVANTAYGVVLGTVALLSPVVAALAGLVMVGLYVGFRGFAAAVVDRRRAESLTELTHRLLDLPGGDGVDDFVDHLVRSFGGTRADVVVPDGDAHVRVTATEHGVVREPLAELPRAGLLATAIARQSGIVETATLDDGTVAPVLAAPIEHRGRVLGAVAISGRRGLESWDQGDASLLAAVATEVAVALENVALFERLRHERARLESETRKLSDILTAASDGIASLDADGSVVAWNPGMATITGVDAEAAVGHAWSAVLRLKDEEGAELASLGEHVLTRVLAGEAVDETASLQVMRRDGGWRRVVVTASSVRGDTAGRGGLVLVARDVTAERELEDLKADFISTVSHELRTPLTPLKGFLATLQHPSAALTGEQLRSVHASMASQLLRLETLISDLLAVAELDHGRFDLVPEPVALATATREAVEVEATDELDRVRVEVPVEVTAMADPVALLRVVRALVSNAVKHTDGEVRVVVGEVDEWATVTVQDEGPGIASWDQQRVFGRFERLGNHLRRTQGPGLGLTIARTLARRLGGDIDLESELGHGCTFVLRVPVARPRPVPLRSVRDA